jgi:hypothetical protein
VTGNVVWATPIDEWLWVMGYGVRP